MQLTHKEFSSRGGKKRKANLTKKQLRDIAMKGVYARIAKKKLSTGGP